MQYARCTVQLSGDAGTRIPKAPVTPAEVVVLRAIHGQESVSNFELLRGGVNDKASHAEEIKRLRDTYTALTEKGELVVDTMFPGHAPQLPTTFREIGVSLEEPKVERAPTPAADTNGDGQLSVAELKAELTRLGVPFKGNASKATLEALYQDALDAEREPMAAESGGDAGDEEDDQAEE